MKRIISIFQLGLLAATGGGINASLWLWYTRIIDDPVIAWHVIPAGAIHGGVLAVVAFSMGRAMVSRPVALQLVIALAVGWCTGYLSWLPLGLSIFWGSLELPLLQTLTYPFLRDDWSINVISPFHHFGLVALLHYLATCFLISAQHPLSRHMLFAIAAGVIGSVSWWVIWEPWYFSLIHGIIWGILVGTGTKIALRRQ